MVYGRMVTARYMYESNQRASLQGFPLRSMTSGVSAIENLLSSWSTTFSKAEEDAGSGGSSSDDDSEYEDTDDESASSSGSGSGSSSSSESGSHSDGSSSSDASDIDRSELEALLDESRDVLADVAGGTGRPTKRLRR